MTKNKVEERYEYKTIECVDAEDMDKEWLNKLGAEGWELVSSKGGGFWEDVTFIFKRRKYE